MIYVPGLILALAAFWFAMSGQTTLLFGLLGLISVLLVLWLCARLGIIDRNASPYHRAPQLLLWLIWLLGEIVKSNVFVIRRIFGPARAIDPAVVKVNGEGNSDLAKTLFANSITLTPGTVTVEVEEGQFMIHALDGPGATPSSFSAMARNAARAAGDKS